MEFSGWIWKGNLASEVRLTSFAFHSGRVVGPINENGIKD
jgi:hypothetical protein